jgi:hypothetical protein
MNTWWTVVSVCERVRQSASRCVISLISGWYSSSGAPARKRPIGSVAFTARFTRA